MDDENKCNKLSSGQITAKALMSNRVQTRPQPDDDKVMPSVEPSLGMRNDSRYTENR